MSETTPVPAAPEPAPAGAAPVVVVEPVRTKRGVGVTAFVLGLLAFLGDIVFLIVGLVSVLSATASLIGLFTGSNADLGGFVGVVIALVVGAIGGTILALLAIIIGIVGAATGRGRGLAVTGIVLGALVLATRIIFLILIATSGTTGTN